MLKNLRRYLVTGVVIWVPVIVTVLVVRFLLRLMDRTLVVIPPAWQPEALLGFKIPGLGLLLSLLVLFVTGLLAAAISAQGLGSGEEEEAEAEDEPGHERAPRGQASAERALTGRRPCPSAAGGALYHRNPRHAPSIAPESTASSPDSRM